MNQDERILKGALELFLAGGIKSVTMDDIAKHLGMSKKTIYQHFADKNDLVTALVMMRVQQDEKDMDVVMRASDNVITQMINWMKCSEEMLARVNSTFMHDLKKYHPEGWSEFRRFKAEVLLVRLEALLKQGIKEGFIRPEINVEIIARMRLVQVEAGFNSDIYPPSKFSIWAVQQQFVEQFNYGIVTLKGYKLLNEYQNKLTA